MEKHANKPTPSNDGRAYRGEADEEMPEAPAKTLYAYDYAFKDVKSFSSSKAPGSIEKAIADYLRGMEVEPLIHKSKFKMDLEFPNEGSNNIEA